MKKFSKLISAILVLSLVLVGVIGAAAWDATGGCGDNARYYIDDTLLTFEGTGGIGDYNGTQPEWRGYGNKLTTAVFEEGITEIGYESMAHLSKLTDVTIASTVTKLVYGSFARCTSLAELNIPQTVTSIGDRAFIGCTALNKITILNADCAITDSADVLPANTVIYGYRRSTAQSYAQKYNRTFVPIDPGPEVKRSAGAS